MMAETGIDQAVVYMVAVRHEEGFSLHLAGIHDAGHIESRQEEHAERKQDGHHIVGFPGTHLRVLDGQIAQQEAYGQGAGVAHKQLAHLPHEHIIIKERNQQPHTGKAEHAVENHVAEEERNTHCHGSHDGQSGGKPVDSVNKVNGVRNQYYDKYRERNGNVNGELMYAENSIYILISQRLISEKCDFKILHSIHF